MARFQKSRRQRSAISAVAPHDLHDYARRLVRRSGRSRKVDLIAWTVTDDWPEDVPVTEAEVREGRTLPVLHLLDQGPPG
jgi:hypothetical protein